MEGCQLSHLLSQLYPAEAETKVINPNSIHIFGSLQAILKNSDKAHHKNLINISCDVKKAIDTITTN